MGIVFKEEGKRTLQLLPSTFSFAKASSDPGSSTLVKEKEIEWD